MCLGSGNDLQTPQVRRVSTFAWRVKSVGSEHKYWPPLETAVTGVVFAPVSHTVGHGIISVRRLADGHTV